MQRRVQLGTAAALEQEQRITLDQYFKNDNFRVVEIVEEDWGEPQNSKQHPPQQFRIKRMSATKRNNQSIKMS